MDRQIAENLLAKAAETQTVFWDALSELEIELGCEVSGNQDLEGMDIDTLIELGEERKQNDNR